MQGAGERSPHLGTLYDDQVRLRPEKPAIIDTITDTVLSYADLAGRIAQAGHQLRNWNVTKGDRVAFVLPNSVTYLSYFFGAMRIGAVPVPINIEIPTETAGFIIRNSDAVGVVTTSEFSEYLNAIDDSLPPVGITDGPPAPESGFTDLHTQIDDQPTTINPTPVDPGDPALQPYTSGSTGRPKGVVLTHEGAYWNVRVFVKVYLLDHTERAIVSTPLYHKNAMVTSIKPLLNCGGSIVLLERFDSRRVIDAIHEYGVTYMSGVPAMFETMLQHEDLLHEYDLRSLEWVKVGSDSVPTSLRTRFEASFDTVMLEGYGLTEGGPSVSSVPRWGAVEKTGSAGIPYPGTTLKIVDPDTGAEQPPGEVGELLVANPGLGTYYNLPDANTDAFSEYDGTRFLHSGDLAYLDDDGYLYLVGRLDDMMIVGGENVYPAEVETLLQHHPGVEEVVVVSAPHPTKNEAPVAFVIPSDARVTEDDIKTYALEHGPAYAHPRRVFFVDSFPLTGTKKIDRTALEHQAKNSITDTR